MDATLCGYKGEKGKREKKQTDNTNFSGQLVKDERENNSEPNHAGQGPSVKLKVSVIIKNINNQSHFSFGFSISFLEVIFFEKSLIKLSLWATTLDSLSLSLHEENTLAKSLFPSFPLSLSFNPFFLNTRSFSA